MMVKKKNSRFILPPWESRDDVMLRLCVTTVCADWGLNVPLHAACGCTEGSGLLSEEVRV